MVEIKTYTKHPIGWIPTIIYICCFKQMGRICNYSLIKEHKYKMFGFCGGQELFNSRYMMIN